MGTGSLGAEVTGVSFSTCVLAVAIESSGRATSVLHSRAVSAGPQVNFKKDFKAL